MSAQINKLEQKNMEIIGNYRISRKLPSEESNSVHLSENESVDTKDLCAIKKVKLELLLRGTTNEIVRNRFQVCCPVLKVPLG
jgi:hypothetical protein